MKEIENKYPKRELEQKFNLFGSPLEMWMEDGTIFAEFMGLRLVADNAGRFAPTNPEFYIFPLMNMPGDRYIESAKKATLQLLSSDFVMFMWQDYKLRVKNIEIKRNR